MPQNPKYRTTQLTLQAREALRDFTAEVTTPQGRRVNMSEALLAALATAQEVPEVLHRHLDRILAERVDNRQKSPRHAA